MLAPCLVLGSSYFKPFNSDKSLCKVGVSSEGQLLEMLRRKRLQQRPLQAQRHAIAQALDQMIDEGWVLDAARRYRPGAQ
ncbi:hypothetical protein [Pseudomonas sp. TCU-HL1]|uniref:hypothetical protein n=1 Tax=Pseudomonas sp. TCU-HL1 TaxID=1856685 RepID=UPI001F39650F|nr:hypothetical protein [Pseudomonas sp. TCU-HL1]